MMYLIFGFMVSVRLVGRVQGVVVQVRVCILVRLRVLVFVLVSGKVIVIDGFCCIWYILLFMCSLCVDRGVLLCQQQGRMWQFLQVRFLLYRVLNVQSMFFMYLRLSVLQLCLKLIQWVWWVMQFFYLCVYFRIEECVFLLKMLIFIFLILFFLVILSCFIVLSLVGSLWVFYLKMWLILCLIMVWKCGNMFFV